MKIKITKAVVIITLKLPQKTKPRENDRFAGRIATGAPMSTSLGGRYFHKNDWWDKALEKDIGGGN